MLNSRQNGLMDFRDQPYAMSIRYDQDDNYYRLMRMVLIADSTSAQYWNATEFFAGALLNPIPRYFWPEKPLLTQEFYGDWKLFYVTTSYVGECIAMFGKWGGIVVALAIGAVGYRVLERAVLRVSSEGGGLLYFCICLYVYSIMRSLYNIGMNSTFMMVAGGVVLFVNYRRNIARGRKMEASRRSRRPEDLKAIKPIDFKGK